MTGIVLKISGLLLFITGIYLFKTSKKNNSVLPNKINIETPAEFLNTEPKIIEDDSDLEKVIEIAIADGVLTKNEKSIIHKITDQKGLDFDQVIKNVEQKIADSDRESETELIDYNNKNGYDFEKFIVQKFNKKYFNIKEWAGDKYVNGRYSDKNKDPDILFELKAEGKTHVFAVECKWRKSTLPDGIEFAGKEQFQRYKKYEESKNIPVFVAIGIGGTGGSPNILFVVPLRKLNSNFIDWEKLQIFTKEVDRSFYYNLADGYINSIKE